MNQCNECNECNERATTALSDGRTYCNDHYFVSLQKVIRKASNAVVDTVIERCRDATKHPHKISSGGMANIRKLEIDLTTQRNGANNGHSQNTTAI